MSIAVYERKQRNEKDIIKFYDLKNIEFTYYCENLNSENRNSFRKLKHDIERGKIKKLFIPEASAISTSERLIKDFILICKDNGCKVYDKSLDNYLTEGKGYTSVINLSILSK